MLLLGDRTADMRKLVPVPESLVAAGLAAGVLALGILKFLTANELRRWPEWIGLLLALAIGAGGWLIYSEKSEAAPEAQPTNP